MLRFNSYLLALAAEFTGRFTPYQGVQIAPLAGGVSVAATDRGALTMLGYDPAGTATEEIVVLPDAEFARACKGIKTAQREVTIEAGHALVTTYYKEHSTSKEFAVHTSAVPFPPLAEVVSKVIATWGEQPSSSVTAGRYDLDLLHKAIKAMAGDSDSIVLSGFHGGPLRLQREDTGVVVFLMPQTAQPIPPLPPWLDTYAQSSAPVRTPVALGV